MCTLKSACLEVNSFPHCFSGTPMTAVHPSGMKKSEIALSVNE